MPLSCAFSVVNLCTVWRSKKSRETSVGDHCRKLFVTTTSLQFACRRLQIFYFTLFFFRLLFFPRLYHYDAVIHSSRFKNLSGIITRANRRWRNTNYYNAEWLMKNLKLKERNKALQFLHELLLNFPYCGLYVPYSIAFTLIMYISS